MTKDRTRVEFPQEKKQIEIYDYWRYNAPTLDELAAHYNIKRSTIQLILTRGLDNKWHLL